MQNNIVPLIRLVPKATRRDAILNCPEAQGPFAALAQGLADQTELSVDQVIAVLAVSVSAYDKAQADALVATVARRRLQERAIAILTAPEATRDIELAKWLTLETTVSSSVAIEVMARTHAAENTNV
jgi:hypothetical protein